MLRDDLLQDCRAVALAYRQERLRWAREGREYAFNGDPAFNMAMAAYCLRHPEFRNDVHADRLVVSRRVNVLLRYAYELAGKWIYGGEAKPPDQPTQLPPPHW